MSTAEDDAGELRIGGWVPPPRTGGPDSDDAPVTELIPVVDDAQAGTDRGRARSTGRGAGRVKHAWAAGRRGRGPAPGTAATAQPHGPTAQPDGATAQPDGATAEPAGPTAGTAESTNPANTADTAVITLEVGIPTAGEAGPGDRAGSAGMPEMAPFEPADRPARRARWAGAAAVVALAVVSAAAAVPIALSRSDGPDRPDQIVLPAPSVPPNDLVAPTGGATPGGPSATPTATPRATRPATTRGAARTPQARTTPTAPAPANVVADGTLSIEAEGPGAERGGDTNTRAVAGASGGVVVGNVGEDSDNVLRFTGITVPEDGRYDLVVHYASDERRSAYVRVNGRSHDRLNFPSTGDRNTVKTMTVRLRLAAGPNTVEFSNPFSRAPDFDRVTLAS